jgi:LysR family transcriptional regulator, cyn operon transcriptional activator
MLLRHIRYFLAVAEHGNFTRAAEALHVSQPTLSQQIRQLEDTLGVPLFDRAGRGVRLTEFGDVYLGHARAALRQLDAGRRALHDVEDLQSGSLRIALTPTFTAYLVGPLVERFHARYPKLTLSIREMPQEQIETLLLEDELDLGFAFEPAGLADIETLPLWEEALALVVGAGHRHADRREPLAPADLADEPLILLSRAFATRVNIDQYFAAHRMTPRVAIEVESLNALIEVVTGNRLATVLPAAVAERHAAMRVVALTPPLPRRTAALLARRGAYRSAAARALTACVRELAW